MTEQQGIRERHSRKCSSRGGGQCNCEPSYEASVYDARESRKQGRTVKIRRTFAGKEALAAAQEWRASIRWGQWDPEEAIQRLRKKGCDSPEVEKAIHEADKRLSGDLEVILSAQSREDAKSQLGYVQERNAKELHHLLSQMQQQARDAIRRSSDYAIRLHELDNQALELADKLSLADREVQRLQSLVDSLTLADHNAFSELQRLDEQVRVLERDLRKAQKNQSKRSDDPYVKLAKLDILAEEGATEAERESARLRASELRGRLMGNAA